MNSVLIAAQSTVLSVDVVVIMLLSLAIWHERSAYLGWALAAGGVEFLRKCTDTVIALDVNIPLLNQASGFLQIVGTLLFLNALAKFNDRDIRYFSLAILVTFVLIATFLAKTDTDDKTARWVLYYSPLIFTHMLLLWFAWNISTIWLVSRVYLISVTVILLVVRCWMPLNMDYGQLFLTLYHTEAIFFALLIMGLAFYSIEIGYRNVQNMLLERSAASTALQSVFDNMADIVLATDGNGLLISWNERAKNAFGYSGRDVVGKLSISSLFTDPDINIQSESATEFEGHMRGAGEEILVYARVNWIATNDTEYAIYLIQDITAKRQMEKSRRQLESQLEQTRNLESLGVLAGGIAHNFNNILTSLFGNISLAKGELATDSPAATYLDRSLKSMRSATNLTNQMLTFSKGGEPVLEATKLRPLVEDALAFHLSEHRNIKTSISEGPDLWLADIDSGQIQQVIGNLVLNAQQAMPQGGTLTVTLENETRTNANGLLAGNYIKLSIYDEGTGINPEHLQNIFDPYFTTKQTGSGLGLATVYSIVRKHGGDITVDSTMGIGSCFHIYLRAAKTAA